jgi:hypothetical protein
MCQNFEVVFFVPRNKLFHLVCPCVILPESTRIYGENTTPYFLRVYRVMTTTVVFIKSRQHNRTGQNSITTILNSVHVIFDNNYASIYNICHLMQIYRSSASPSCRFYQTEQLVPWNKKNNLQNLPNGSFLSRRVISHQNWSNARPFSHSLHYPKYNPYSFTIQHNLYFLTTKDGRNCNWW